MKRSTIIRDIILTARPLHYTKNLIVYGPIVFSRHFQVFSELSKVLFTFLSFCLAASAIYFANDIFDRKEDQIHPEKKNRPIASGRLPVKQAVIVNIICMASSIAIAVKFVNPLTTFIVAGYILINLLYSWKLKHIVLIDIFIISLGFLFRVIAGGTAIHVEISEWILLCVILLSLFLALAKRRGELINADFSLTSTTRKVLVHYNEKFLDQMIVVVAALTIISYCLYTILNDNFDHLLYSSPFVLFGIFRYLYIIYIEKGGEKPEKEMLKDKTILSTILLWCLSVIIIIRFFNDF